MTEAQQTPLGNLTSGVQRRLHTTCTTQSSHNPYSTDSRRTLIALIAFVPVVGVVKLALLQEPPPALQACVLSWGSCTGGVPCASAAAAQQDESTTEEVGCNKKALAEHAKQSARSTRHDRCGAVAEKAQARERERAPQQAAATR